MVALTNNLAANTDDAASVGHGGSSARKEEKKEAQEERDNVELESIKARLKALKRKRDEVYDSETARDRQKKEKFQA